LLGADCGQGYAIARPMSADALPGWLQRYSPLVDPARPRTALGAVAAHWRWEHSGMDANAPDPDQAHQHCALGRYLHDHGLDGGEIGRLHEQIHTLSHTGDPPKRQDRDLVDRLFTLLMKANHESD